MASAGAGGGSQSLNRAIIANNRTRKELHVLIKERDAARRTTKDQVRAMLDENTALTQLATQLSVRGAAPAPC